jgi:hypothetical protein
LTKVYTKNLKFYPISTIARGFNRAVQIAIVLCVPTVETVGYGYKMLFVDAIRYPAIFTQLT